MRKLLIPAVALSSMLAVTAAFAAQQTEGKVVSVDRSSLILKLSDGHQYKLADKAEAASLRPGQTVYISFDEKNGVRMAHIVSPQDVGSDG